MQDSDCGAQVKATADLSPLSPSPLHSVPSEVLPALQDTADILDAMTEVPATAQPTGLPSEPIADPTPTDLPPDGQADEDSSSLDLDSLEDAYGEEEDGVALDAAQSKPEEETDGVEDDYLRSFDSPVQDVQEDDSSDGPKEGSNPQPNPGAKSPLTPEASSHTSSHDAQGAPESIAEPSTSTQHPSHESAVVDAAAAAPRPTEIPQTNPIQTQPPTGQLSQTLPMLGGHTDVDSGDSHAADISRLVAEMAGQAPEHDNGGPQPGRLPSPHAKPNASQALPAVAPSSLPPRPPVPQDIISAHVVSEDTPAAASSSHRMPMVPSGPAMPPSSIAPPAMYVAAGAPGTYNDFASVPISSLNPPTQPYAPGLATNQPGMTDVESAWQRFNDDERRYMTEARWDKFPEGSRIFIGNLSSERVSKRDVFDAFYQFGRLAQISLKSAYGFVQYHSVDDAQTAIRNAQGMEIKGRKIHLEISRVQKRKGEDRARSSERSGRGGRDASHKADRSEFGPHNRRGRDEQRHGGRGSPPARSKADRYGRDRGYHEAPREMRGRSRSPPSHGRHEQYRRRSPSPASHYGRNMPGDELQIPRRYGSQVPDVQFLLLQDVGRDFVKWVQDAFTERGLRVDVMYLNPSFPREAVIQRQAVEGVHAVVELDMRAHNYGKIPLRVFDRHSGTSSARFDDYQDLTPDIAAQLVLRAKAQPGPAQSYNQHGPPPQASYTTGGYGQPQQQQPPPQQPVYGLSVPPHAPSFSNGAQNIPGHPGRDPAPPTQPSNSHVDISGVLGHMDNSTLQQLLSSIQNPQTGGQGHGQHPQTGIPVGPAQQQIGSQIDVLAILNSLKGSQTGGAPGPHTSSYGGHGHGYPPNGVQPSAQGHQMHPHAANAMGSESATQVNAIMAQLAKFRQA